MNAKVYELMRCDLHVHSGYSGRRRSAAARPSGARVLFGAARGLRAGAPSRNGPRDAHRPRHDRGRARARARADCFVSEELTVLLEGGRQLHLNVFGIGERQHARAAGAPARPGGALRLSGRRAHSSVRQPPVLRAHRSAGARRLPPAARAAGADRDAERRDARGAQRAGAARGRACGMASLGGSDAHSLAHVARAFTTVPGARTREDFLAGLRTGLCVPSGRSGSYARLTERGRAHLRRRLPRDLARAGPRPGARSARRARS